MVCFWEASALVVSFMNGRGRGGFNAGRGGGEKFLVNFLYMQ